MKKLNNYVSEAWSGVKKHTNNAEIAAWCDEMSIKNYTINSQGEIDVNGIVNLRGKDFKELPYKFGKVNGTFSFYRCKNLKSLKNCPNYVGGYFSCNSCSQLDSLKGCPKEVDVDFYCCDCKRKFTKKEVMSLCKVNGGIIN